MARRKWTDERICAELRPLIEAKMSPIAIHAHNGALYSAAHKRFGGIHGFCETYGLELTDGRVEKYPNEDVDAFISKVTKDYVNYSKNWLTLKGTKEDRRYCDAAIRLYGSWNKALEANGVKPARAIRKITDRDDLISRYSADISSGKYRGDIKYHTSVMKYFGSFDAIDEYLGIDSRQPPKPEPVVYGIRELDEKVAEIIRNCTEDSITAAYIDSIDVNIAFSIRHHYSSITEYFSGLDIDFCAKPHVPFQWTPENTKRQLLRWAAAGTPLNYTGVAQKCSGILRAARKYFGGWGQLLEACGLNYDDYRVDTDTASYYGREFELILGDILTDSGMEFTKYKTQTNCHPDFVIGGHWIDAKLSEWTVHIPDSTTVRKYEPNCDSLTIIFLRGNRNCDRKLSEKTRLVNVYHYVDGLADDKKRYYYEKLDAIERSLSVVA